MSNIVVQKIAITGTPGTGKTSVGFELISRGHRVIDLNSFAKENGLLQDWDGDLQTFEVDISKLENEVSKLKVDQGSIFYEGHLSHFLSVDVIIVLRCNPCIIKQRLEERGYVADKVLENLEAEALDVILVESMDSGAPVYELDCSLLTIAEIANGIEEIITGTSNKYLPGNIDWSEGLLKWC